MEEALVLEDEGMNLEGTLKDEGKTLEDVGINFGQLEEEGKERFYL